MPAHVYGQSENSTAIQMQRLAPDPGAEDILGVQSSEVRSHFEWQVGAYLNFADDVLEVRDAEDNAITRIIDSQTGLDLVGSIGLWDRIDLGLVVPITVQRNEQMLGTMPLDLSSAGLGDVRLVPKVRIAQLGSRLHFAISLPFTLPTGTGDFLSDERVTAEPRLIGELRGDNGARIAANAGFRFRPERRFVNLDVSNELTYGLGVRVPLGRTQPELAVITTLAGSLVLDENDGEERPIEWLAGLEYTGIRGFTVGVGAGPGLSKGFGTPDFRVVAGVTYRRVPEPPPICPYGPEDFDSFEDDDNCLDPDNDGDGIADEVDTCPNEPETPNDFDDDDGCPDQNLTDPADPQVTEPLPPLTPPGDADNDGIRDDADSCPDQPEDTDSFEDLDGCPEPDNDSDGILDGSDGCPLQAEIINGVEDEDGCPDEGQSSVTITDKAILILDKVYFETAKATIKPQSFGILNQVASTLRANPQITKLRVEGHTDNRGADQYNLDLSQSRADAVREYLISRGVQGEILESRGYGETRPIDSNKTKAGRSKNRRVEFRILEVAGKPVDESGEPAGEPASQNKEENQ